MLENTDLRLVEVFHTFQGEGANWGRRALFVRMPFCNLACSWCDTQFNKFEKWTDEAFKEFALQEPNRFAVLTGGEPMMNKQSPRVIEILKDLGFTIACETNGTFPILSGIDWVTVSPKRDADYEIVDGNYNKIDEIKVVVDKGFDTDILKRFEKKAWPHTILSLSPEFNEMEENLKVITEYIKTNPKWKISLQTHKWLGVR